MRKIWILGLALVLPACGGDFQRLANIDPLARLETMTPGQAMGAASGILGGSFVGYQFGGGTGQILMTAAFGQGNPSRVAVVALSQLVFAFVYDRIFWADRPFNVWSVVGMALVAAPTAWLLSGIGARVKDRTQTLGR